MTAWNRYVGRSSDEALTVKEDREWVTKNDCFFLYSIFWESAPGKQLEMVRLEIICIQIQDHRGQLMPKAP
jgi:hypothetical protein